MSGHLQPFANDGCRVGYIVRRDELNARTRLLSFEICANQNVRPLEMEKAAHRSEGGGFSGEARERGDAALVSRLLA